MTGPTGLPGNDFDFSFASKILKTLKQIRRTTALPPRVAPAGRQLLDTTQKIAYHNSSVFPLLQNSAPPHACQTEHIHKHQEDSIPVPVVEQESVSTIKIIST